MLIENQALIWFSHVDSRR